MANPTRIPGDITIQGNLTCRSVTGIPAGAITAAQLAGAIPSSKVKARRVLRFAEPYDQITTAKRVNLGTIYGSVATVADFRAKLNGASINTVDAEINIDLLKNGTTILTATVDIVAGSTTAFVSAPGFTSTALVADDVLDASIAVAAGGGALGDGLIVELLVDDEPPD